MSSRRFDDQQLERVYRHQQLHHHGLVYVLCVFTAALLLVALNHLPTADLTLLLATSSAAISLGLNIVLNVQRAPGRRGTVAAVGCWLCATVLCALPAGGQSALIPTLIASFTFYTFLPFDFLWVVGAASFLSLAQIATFILLRPYQQQRSFSVEQLIATIIVHCWGNFIGAYLFITRNRLSRAAFLNARNALSSHQEKISEKAKMGTLLSTALPPYIIASVQSQLGDNSSVDVPRVYVEKYDNVSVVYAKLYGLQALINQVSVQDAGRLLNEFSNRIDLLIRRHSFIRVQSDAIVAVAGIPAPREDHAVAACQLARELATIFRSFCDATSSDIQLKVGIGSGPIASGIIGARKWHFDVLGPAYDSARQLEGKAPLGAVLLSEETKREVERDFAVERFDHRSWRLQHLLPSSTIYSQPTLPPSLVFPSHARRFSLVTIPQAVNRLLQSVATSNNESGGGSAIGRRKRKEGSVVGEKLEVRESPVVGQMEVMGLWTLAFGDAQLEAGYHSLVDRWFIPALAISILFLLTYGVYQVLVMPLLASTLAIILVAMGAVCFSLLLLYINYFETLCQFLTRTAAGHSLFILLLLVVMFLCPVVSTFSCPSFVASTVCHPVHYPMASIALWMLTTASYIRFNSLYLLMTHSTAILIYAIHFWTHPDLYAHSSLRAGWRMEVDLLVGLATLAMLIFLQSRRNERALRLDYVASVRAIAAARQFERFEYLNEQILLNILPSHIAQNYSLRSDPYVHMCSRVAMLTLRLGRPSTDWQGELDFDRLNRLVFEMDQLVGQYIGVEKVMTAHCLYTAAVGVLPEVSRNVHDAPLTIGDLIASLTEFALGVGEIAKRHGVELAAGVECGSALSLVVGRDSPRYEVVGSPCNRSYKLMEAASVVLSERQLRLLVSEEILLALKPRGRFHFDENSPVTVAPGLVGYSLVVGEVVVGAVVGEVVVGVVGAVVNGKESRIENDYTEGSYSESGGDGEEAQEDGHQYATLPTDYSSLHNNNVMQVQKQNINGGGGNGCGVPRHEQPTNPLEVLVSTFHCN